MGWGSSREGLEALLVQSGGVELVLLLALRPWMVWRSPQQPPLVRMDAELLYTSRTLGLSSPCQILVHRVSWGYQWVGSPDSDPPPSWEGPLPGTTPNQRRRGTTSPPPSTPSCSWLVGVAPSSRQINLLHPMLEGAGICHHFLSGNFSDIPAYVNLLGWWHKLLPMKAWWFGRSLEVSPLHS